MKIGSIIISIFAGFMGLPAALCAGMCAAVLTSEGNNDAAAGEAGVAFMAFGIIGAILAIAGGILTIRPGKNGPIMQAVALGLTVLTCFTFNPLSLFVAILLMVSTILGFMKKDQPAS